MVLVFAENLTSRFYYTLDLIFKEVLLYPYLMTDDYNLFKKSTAHRINYSNNELKDVLTINPSGLLNEEGIRPQSFGSTYWNGMPVIYSNSNSQVPFDLFSAIFFLVTRYEEYLPFQPDNHGRFEAHQSTAWKYKFLEIPVIDLWCKQLAFELGIQENCRGIMFLNFRFQLTIDIDRAWEYKNLGTNRSIGALVLKFIKGNPVKFIEQIKVLAGLENDPADTFDFLAEIRQYSTLDFKYFFLFGDYGKFDKNNPVSHKSLHDLVKRMADKDIIGLHPSYASNSSFAILKKEHETLEGILGSKIKISRQHFLKLHMPETYRNLIDLGIEEDYTMGYSARTGFRASIARPFYFYDLHKEKQTNLRIFPFVVMDRTLLSYLKYTPERAIKEFYYYSDTIRSVGGTYVVIWHNTSLSDKGEWKGWKSVFQEMAKRNIMRHTN